MKSDKHDKKMLKVARSIARDEELARRQLIGKPRSKSWGGKEGSKTSRRKAKSDLREFMD